MERTIKGFFDGAGGSLATISPDANIKIFDPSTIYEQGDLSLFSGLNGLDLYYANKSTTGTFNLDDWDLVGSRTPITEPISDSLNWQIETRLATVTNINLTAAPATHDGITLLNGDRVLVYTQTDQKENGIYIFNGTGNAMTRASNADTGTELMPYTTLVTEGTHANKIFTCTANTAPVIGTDNINFAIINNGTTYTNGAGLALTGSTFSVASEGVTNAMLAGSIAASKLVGTDINIVGTVATGTWNATTIALNKGGTGSTTASGARTNLGVVIGSNVQAWDADLDAIAAIAGSSGLLKKTAANTWSLDTNTYQTTETKGTGSISSNNLDWSAFTYQTLVLTQNETVNTFSNVTLGRKVFVVSGNFQLSINTSLIPKTNVVSAQVIGITNYLEVICIDAVSNSFLGRWLLDTSENPRRFFPKLF